MEWYRKGCFSDINSAVPPPSWTARLRSGLQKQQTLRPQTQQKAPEGEENKQFSAAVEGLKGYTLAGPGSHLSLLGLILTVLGEEVGEDVPAAAGHVDQGTLLPQAQPRRHRQHQGDGLDHQGPLAQVASDDEPTQDGLDLWTEEEEWDQAEVGFN